MNLDSSFPAAVGSDLAGADIFNITGASRAMLSELDPGDALESELFLKPYPRPKRVPNDFNVAIIIAAALIFIVIIAWFEALRIWLEYSFNSSTKILFNKAIGDTVYAVISTIISLLIIWLIWRLWIKK